MAAFLFIFGPMIMLALAAGMTLVRCEPRPWAVLAVLAGWGTLVWLGFVGLYQHAPPCGDLSYTDCPTVYGYDPPLPDEHPLGGILLLGGWALGAAWAGSRRSAPPVAIGAALVVLPTMLVAWTAPRGDDTGLWGLWFWYLPVLGSMAAAFASAVGADWRHIRGRPSH